MMTEEPTICPNCAYNKALTHYDSSGIVNWIACPKCRKYFEFGKEIVKEHEKDFWKHVESDTGYIMPDEEHNKSFEEKVIKNPMFDDYDKGIIRSHLSNFYCVFQLGFDAGKESRDK